MPEIFNLDINFELLLVAFGLLLAMIASTMSLAWHYVHAWRNTPLAADDMDLETRLRQKRERLVDLDAGIVERENNLRQRETADADVRYLESRRDEIKAEIAALGDGRAQVEAYEAELQELVEQLAAKSNELEEMRRACIEQEKRVEATERRLETAENRIEGFRSVEAALREEISQLENEADEARTLQNNIGGLRDNVAALKNDQTRLEAEKTRLETILGELPKHFSPAPIQTAKPEEKLEERSAAAPSAKRPVRRRRKRTI